MRPKIETVCRTCGGNKSITAKIDGKETKTVCPTCKGTGKQTGVWTK